MNPLWTAHLKDPELQRLFGQQVQNSRAVLERLKEIVELWEADLDASETNTEQYESPAWAALQADRNGFRRAMRRIKQYITLDQRINNG